MDLPVPFLKHAVRMLEKKTFTSMLSGLQADEIRLMKCIDDIQIFHKDMFVLPTTEKTAINSKVGISNNNQVMESTYSATEPKSSSNESELLKLLQSNMNGIYSNVPESDDNVGKSNVEVNDVEVSVNDVEVIANDVEVIANDIPFDNEVTVYDMISSDESKYSSDENQYSSDDYKEESVNKENEFVKKAVLDLLADGENEITELVLHLIFTFSDFRRNLETVQEKVSAINIEFPSPTNFLVKRSLNTLSRNVLYLDKIISKIYSKYFDMLVKC